MPAALAEAWSSLRTAVSRSGSKSMQLKQYLKLSQQLVMTPQLQQAIKLLQLSRAELQEAVQEQLNENPVLEEDQVDPETGEAVPEMAADGTEIGVELPQTNDTYNDRDQHDRVEEGSPDTRDGGSDGEMDWESFVEGYGDYSYSPGAGGQRLSSDDLPTLEQTLSKGTSLFDHLVWQINLSNLDDKEREIATDIIGNIDNDGFFTNTTIDELAAMHDVTADDIEDVLCAVQELDPVGVAARDLQECLLIQAKTYHAGDGILRKIIERHLENLERRNYPAIQKDLGIGQDELIRCIKVISHMEPKPGRAFAESDETQYITPDVHVHKVADDYIVVLNEDGLPKLKISGYYKSAMHEGQGNAKDYIQEKFRSAVWLIRSIHQRQNTIRRVTESIVRFQREFLDRGPQYLRPLILRDVAEDIGVHESTVSRVTTNKYVHTPQGIYELKYFFNSRIGGMYGAEDLASESVKLKIKEIVGKEDQKNPLSDQAIADMLKGQNIDIARRTVAKYREMMNILPSSQRKRLF